MKKLAGSLGIPTELTQILCFIESTISHEIFSTILLVPCDLDSRNSPKRGET